MIPYGRQDISEDDVAAVIEVLQSDWLTQGPMVPLFEQTVAEKVKAKQAVAVNSATSALHIACLALDLKPKDWLWTSPNTFVASANCALYCGAQVDFVDIDPHTYNISVEALTAKLEQAEALGRLPKILIPVHFSGQSCAMAEIHALSQRYGFKIIEDASHAIGGFYKQEPIGCCKYSDITIFSFHPVKIITSAEGGMAVTNNPELASKMQLLRSHGITRDPQKMVFGETKAAWYYEQIDLGFNYRMTDLQAALGLSQLARLEHFVKRRHELASYYNDRLKNVPLVLPFQDTNSYSAYHLYVIQVDPLSSPLNRDKLFDSLRQAGIGVNFHYIPVYLHPFYEKMGFKKGHCLEAERYYEQAITLPIFYRLQENQQQEVINSLHKLLSI